MTGGTVFGPYTITTFSELKLTGWFELNGLAQLYWPNLRTDGALLVEPG